MNRKIFEKLAQLAKSIPENAKHMQNNASRKAEQLKNGISEKAEELKNEASEKASSIIQKGNQDIKNTLQRSKITFETQKEKLNELSSKVGEKSKDLLNDIEKLKDIQIVKKTTNIFTGKEESKRDSFFQQQLQKYVDPNKKEVEPLPTPQNKQKKQFNELFFSLLFQKSLAKAKSVPSSWIGKIMSNLYWRFFLLLSVLMFIYISPQLIKSLGQVYIGLRTHEDKLQGPKKIESEEEKKKKQANS